MLNKIPSLCSAQYMTWQFVENFIHREQLFVNLSHFKLDSFTAVLLMSLVLILFWWDGCVKNTKVERSFYFDVRLSHCVQEGLLLWAHRRKPRRQTNRRIWPESRGRTWGRFAGTCWRTLLPCPVTGWRPPAAADTRRTASATCTQI